MHQSMPFAFHSTCFNHGVKFQSWDPYCFLPNTSTCSEKWETRANYEAHRVKEDSSTRTRGGGFGGLFSITFTSLPAAEAFFDNLACAKGPSLGTSFTLACPYTILAHYTELDWAKEYGVDVGLVRVSVGLEERGVLLDWFRVAVEKAEEAVRDAEV